MTNFSNSISNNFKNMSVYFSRFVASLMMFMSLAGILTTTVLVVSPAQVFAQQTCENKNASRVPSFGSNCVGGVSGISGDRAGIADIIKTVANFLIFVLAALSVLFIVYGGFLYVTDDGSGTKAGQGRKVVLQALIGLVIAVVSFTLVTAVVNTLSTLNFGTTTTTPPAAGQPN